MHGLEIIVIVLGISIAVQIVGTKLRFPTIIGFFITGILAGPDGFQLVRAADMHQVEAISEIGVILLLFTIGVEFSIADLLRIRKTVLMGGSIQVGLTLGFTSLVVWAFGVPWNSAFFVGCLVSLSSTAVVMRVLQQRGEAESPQGRTALGIEIYQDLITVPMMLLLPVLGGTAENVAGEIGKLLLKAIALIALVFLLGKYILPPILYFVARSRSRELFIFAILFCCFAVAYASYLAGISLALGAFIAGLIVSESEYSQQALGEIVPFKEVFASLFFVSVGMLLDIDLFLNEPVKILALAGGAILLKAAIAGFAVRLLGFSLRIAILTGFGLAQIGEFSLILADAGMEHALLGEDLYQTFLAVSILTMAATPFLISLSPKIAKSVMRWPIPAWLSREVGHEHHRLKEGLKDHLIIIGYGLNGKNLSRAAKLGGIPYVIVETNPDTVRRERAQGEPIYYGDATHNEVLELAGINEAKVMVIAISDAAATRGVVAAARRLNPNAHIIARTRFMQETHPLLDLGADEVVPEEFETSVEIFTRVLKRYLVPNDDIEKFIAEIRSDSYAMLRRPASGFVLPDIKLHIPGVELETYRVTEGAEVTVKSIAELNLRRDHGVLIIAIGRGKEMIVSPQPTEKMHPGDLVVAFGTPENLADAARLFRGEARVGS
jgi:CPA2 family monovalent cation:H+ antiporter-2